MSHITTSPEPVHHKAAPDKTGDINKQQQKVARNEVAGRHKNDGQQDHCGALVQPTLAGLLSEKIRSDGNQVITICTTTFPFALPFSRYASASCACAKRKYPVDHGGANAAGCRLVGLQTWRKGDEIVCQADYSLVEASFDILALYSLPRQAFHLPFRRVAGANPMLGNFVATILARHSAFQQTLRSRHQHFSSSFLDAMGTRAIAKCMRPHESML